MKKIVDYHTLYLKNYKTHFNKRFSTTENFIQQKKYQEIENIQNSNILKNYNNSLLFQKKKILIKNNTLKKYKYNNLNLSDSGIIIENIFRNLIVFRKQSLYKNKKVRNVLIRKNIFINNTLCYIKFFNLYLLTKIFFFFI